MPQTTTKTLPPNKVVELTDGDVTQATVINSGDTTIWVKAQTTSDLPSFAIEDGWFAISPDNAMSDSLENIWRGQTDVSRLFAYADFGGTVFISHD